MPPDVAVDRQRGDSDEICYRVANLRHSGSFKERIPANSDVRKYPEGSDPRPDSAVVAPEEQPDDRNQDGVFATLAIVARPSDGLLQV